MTPNLHGFLIVYVTYFVKFMRDLMLPALPALMLSLGAPESVTKLLVSIYFVGMVCSRFLWPITADIIGAKRILLFTTSLCALACVLSIFTSDMTVLIILRFFQGLGAGCLPAITRSIIYQTHGAKKTLKILAYFSVLSAWAPAVATAIGGHVITLLVWQWVFAILAVLSTFLLGAYSFLFKSLEHQRSQHSIFDLFSTYWRAFFESHPRQFTIPYAACNSGINAYFIFAPFYFIKHLHWSPVSFGYLTFILIAGQVVGKISVPWCHERFSLLMIMRLSLLICTIAILILWLSQTIWPDAPWAFVLPMLLYFTGYGLSVPTAKIAIMELMPTKVGTASAVLGFGEALFSAVVTTIVAWWANDNVMSLALVLFALVCISAFCLRAFKR